MNFESQIVGEVPEGQIGFQVLAGTTDDKQVVGLAAFSQGRRVFISGKPGPVFVSVSQVQVGDGGRVVAYSGFKDEKHFVVVNGKIAGGYDWVGKLCLSCDGKSVAYPILRETLANQEYRMMVDGNLGEAFTCIGEMIWHPQKSLLAYVGGSEQGEQVVFENQLLPKFERVRGLQFSPEGRLHYWGLKDGNWWLCNESEPIAPSEGTDFPAFGGLSFIRDGGLCFWSCKKQNWYVHHGSKTYGPWLGFQREVGSPNLSDDLQFVTYVSEQRGRTRVCKNELPGQEFDAVGRPVMQGHLLAYKARIGEEEFLVTNGMKGKAYEVLWPEEREYATYLEDVPVISSKGDKIAFMAAVGTDQMVVVNGMEHPRYPNINGQPKFSGETGRVVYGAQDGHRQFVIIDSEEIGPFDQVFSAKKPSGLMAWDWCPEFSEDGSLLHFFCVEDRKILKCVIKL